MVATKRPLPLVQPNTINHNILLSIQYYTQKQHQHFTTKLRTNFNQEQLRNTRYIPSPQTKPLCHIYTNGCNPENDIAYTQNTIQTQYDITHIYDNIGQHLITILETRIQLWKQYQSILHRSHIREPPTQPFETKPIWLYKDTNRESLKATSSFCNTHFQTSSKVAL